MFSEKFNKNLNWIIIGFIIILILLFVLIGKFVKVFFLVGVINGLILLIVFGMLLVVVYKKSIVGEYKYFLWFIISGVFVVIVMVLMGGYMLMD